MINLKYICRILNINYYDENKELEKQINFNLELMKRQGFVEKIYNLDNETIVWQITDEGKRIFEEGLK